MNTQNVAVKAETPKVAPTVVETKTKDTPVAERQYEATADLKKFFEEKKAFRGKQRQITASLLAGMKKPSLAKALVPEANKLGYFAKAGTEASIAYHLHHLAKDGYAKVTNPTIDVTSDPTAAQK